MRSCSFACDLYRLCSFLTKLIAFGLIRALLHDFIVRDAFLNHKHEFCTFPNKTHQNRSNNKNNSARGSCTNLHELARNVLTPEMKNKWFCMAHNKVARTCTNLHGMCTECFRARDIEVIRFDRQVRFWTNVLRRVKNWKNVFIFYCFWSASSDCV